MAARRLIIVLLVLLALSTVAAVLVPAPPPPGSDTEPTETTTAEPPREPSGRLVRGTIDASAKRLEIVHMRVGDQLSLRVISPAPDTVEILGFGELEPVDPLAPASFDLLAFDTGTFAVRLLEADRTIGEIAIRRRTAVQSRRRAP